MEITEKTKAQEHQREFQVKGGPSIVILLETTNQRINSVESITEPQRYS